MNKFIQEVKEIKNYADCINCFYIINNFEIYLKEKLGNEFRYKKIYDYTYQILEFYSEHIGMNILYCDANSENIIKKKWKILSLEIEHVRDDLSC